MKLVTSETMRALDRHAIEGIGIPGIVLMEFAGRACAERTAEWMEERGLDRVLVLCGPGNNGGDGFVVARHLADWGAPVTAALLAPPARLKGDARTAFGVMTRFPVRIVEVSGTPDPALFEEVAGDGVVVDAMFGTGLERPVEGPYAEAIQLAERHRGLRVAVDIPTGVCSDTGRILGCAFRADLTVTFGAAKIGHFSYPGRAYCGHVEVVDIGIPRVAIDEAPGAVLLDPRVVAPAFGPRDPEAFKNRFGHLLVVGGLSGKGGAALLAAMAAVRCGAGLVTIATDRGAQAHLEGRVPEVMVEGPLEVTADGEVRFEDAELEALLPGKTALAVGPGLSVRPGCDRVLARVLDSGLPVVLDADALNLLAPWTGRPGPRSWGPVIMTPHPGEAARLLGVASTDIQQDRVGAARELATRTQGVAVLKGAGTVVAGPDARLALSLVGGPALATAGTGDVLTGMIGALLARGEDRWDAACGAVFVHGLAGDLAAEDLGEHSVGASDVVERLPEAIRSLDRVAPPAHFMPRLPTLAGRPSPPSRE